MMRLWRLAPAWLACAGSVAQAASLDPSSDDFFEKKIRPVLAEHCYPCHSADAEKIKGGLRVDSLAALLKGGDLGPALVPGDPMRSRMIQAVRYEDPELQMPPRNKKLSDRQIADLAAWVQAGGIWPNSPSPGRDENSAGSSVKEQTAQTHWAFLPVRRSPVPMVGGPGEVANPIDAFLLAKLAQRGIKPNGPAGKREQLRRLFLGLTGIPPKPEEVAAFEEDSRPDAWRLWIDEALTRPEYGERWARHWLDVARFAQSNGYERDGEKPLAWRYRDYVIKAFNEDKPYNRFVREQIAGDLIHGGDFEAIIATGFQRLGVWDDEPDDKKMAEYDELDDILSTTGTAILGLTVGCARCHDHKFDPFPQKDYYRLLAFFRNLRPYENARYTLDSANYLPLEAPSKIEAWEKSQAAKIAALEDSLKTAGDAASKKSIEEKIKKVRDDSPPFNWALAARERSTPPVPTHVLTRGKPGSPGVEVQPGFPAALGGGHNSETPGLERRLVLADWLASPGNPLTARVMVNRIWHHHFGQGLVKTTTDFGKAGSPPSHPQLLDWLAAEFIESGWSVKAIHRLILASNAYRRSSEASNPQAEIADPSNRWLWRQSLRRIEGEAIRDSILAVSGNLHRVMGGRGFFPDLAGEVHAGASRPGLDWEKMKESEQSRRSVYAYVRRTMAIPALETFDYNNTSSPLGERPVTTVAPQALLLLNDRFMKTQASAFARRLRAESGDDVRSRVKRGYALALSRTPSPREIETALSFIERQTASFADLSRRLTFRPDVPSSLHAAFREQLAPKDFLAGPDFGWSFYRGFWSGAYEGIRTVDRPRGPFALWDGAEVVDGVVETRILLDRSSEFVSILMRSSAKDELQRGYEVVFDPRSQRVELKRHEDSAELLAARGCAIPVGRSFEVRVEFSGPRFRVWLEGEPEPRLDTRDPKPMLESGRIGIRAWGAPCSLDETRLTSGGKRHDIPDDPWLSTNAPEGRTTESVARTRAMEFFCLLLLNLNEFVYVD